MGHSQADKAQSRERILQEAATQVRKGGLESLSVARLMRSANLTHGGFYGHFASRSELLVCALERALADGAAASQAATRAGASAQRPANFDALLRSYLSRSHRDAREQGCAIAALAADVARAEVNPGQVHEAREVMSARLDAFIARIAASMEAGEDAAMFAASAMVGGLLLSRVMSDPKRSDALLRAVKSALAERPRDA
jgi:TetR/AcrR family transcriptional regulator, transcriptional repressor for nem operon